VRVMRRVRLPEHEVLVMSTGGQSLD
jgi:hypothetical protein